jgi:hypothetical protein
MPPSRAPWGSWAWSDRSEMAELPDSWLTALQEQSTPRAKSHEEWAALAGSLPDGRRNVALTSLVGHLLRNNINPAAALELLLGFNARSGRPPLPEEDVLTIVRSIAQRETRRRARSRARAGAREGSAETVAQPSSLSFSLTANDLPETPSPYWYYLGAFNGGGGGVQIPAAPEGEFAAEDELDFLVGEWLAGDLEPHPTALGPLSPRARGVQRLIAEHVRLLLGLRVASGEWRPLPYAHGLAQRAGIAADRGTAGRALRALVRDGVLVEAGTLSPLPPHRDGTKTYAPPEGAADFGDLDVRAELIQRLKQRRTT